MRRPRPGDPGQVSCSFASAPWDPPHPAWAAKSSTGAFCGRPPRSSPHRNGWRGKENLERGSMPKPRIAIAMGDPAGIGPEIALKAALDPRVLERCRPLLVGDRGVLETHAKACGLSPRILAFDSMD